MFAGDALKRDFFILCIPADKKTSLHTGQSFVQHEMWINTFKDNQDCVSESFVSRGYIKRKSVSSWKVLPDIFKTLLKDKLE